MSSDEQAGSEVPGGEPDAGLPAGSVVHRVSQESLPVHDLVAGVEAMKAAAAMVLEASRCAWSLSGDEVRGVVEDVSRAMASAEAARLAVVKVLDERPEAVPGADESKVAATFLTGRLNIDPGRAHADSRAAHALDADSGSLPLVGAALAAGEITREHADVCVRAVARLPKRLRVVLLEDEETGETRTGMEIADAFLAERCRQFPARTMKRLVEELVRVLDPDREESFDEDAHLRRGLSLVNDDSTGMGSLRVTLTPADTAVLSAMLSAAGKPHPMREALRVDDTGDEQIAVVKDDRTVAMRRYDALMGLVRAGLNGEAGGAAASPLVNLLVTATVEQVAAAGAAAEQVRRRTAARAAGGTDTYGSSSDPDDRRVPEAFSGNGSPADPACTVGRAAGYATLHRHGPVGARLLAYLTCTATLTKVLLDTNGAPLDVGRAHRLATSSPGNTAAPPT